MTFIAHFVQWLFQFGSKRKNGRICQIKPFRGKLAVFPIMINTFLALIITSTEPGAMKSCFAIFYLHGIQDQRD
jgi:hypothetical protein